MEAAACGKAVVGSDIPGLREAVLQEKTGVLVRPSDPGALSQAMLRLLEDPELRKELGLRAKERAREFSWDANAKRCPELDFMSRMEYFLRLLAHNRRLAKAVGQAGAGYVDQQFSGQGGSDTYLSLLRDYFGSRQMWKEVGQESREVIGEKVRERARVGSERDTIQVDPELSDFAASLYRELKFLGFVWDDTFVEEVLEAAADVAL